MPKRNGFNIHDLKFCVWNVGGLISKTYNKIQDSNFIKQINSYDITLLCETHLGYNLPVNIENFKYFPVCRPQSSNFRFYGGLGILIKNNIRQGVKILENTCKDYQWIKLDKHFFNFVNDIYLCLAYIIPSTSSYLHQHDDDILDLIERDITNKYKNKGDIVLCGDMNARSGTEPDFVQNDIHDEHCPIFDYYEYDNVQDIRSSHDNKIDTRGKQLLELCISANMRILNGRTFGDLYGKFTCHKPVGSSVVDYVIVSENLLPKILSFEVSDFIPNFSDCHCKLSFSILATFVNNTPKCNLKLADFTKGYIWTSKSTNNFRDALCHPVCKVQIEKFLKQDMNPEIAATEFLKILRLAASKAGILQKQTKSKRNPRKCKYFDSELHGKRKTLTLKAELLSKYPFDPLIRGSYFKCYREYTKLRKYKKRHFKQNILDQLDLLRDSDPKKYWKLINSLKESKDKNNTGTIETEEWHTYFSDLNKLADSNINRIQEINSAVENMEKIKHFCELDYRISIKEITDSISNLKNGKASGLDGIPAEMLKAGSPVLNPLLQKLFNIIFSTGFYPLQWSSAYITPIFKSGDPSKPENYRGIAINSCIGKLFNTVLNKRLDKFLIDNNIISNCQIGFTKKSRTSDHIFVLKTLIDKYTHGSNRKLFACFIDLRRAFDTVIHAGIRYKLLQYNIAGRFYSIIKDMYQKNQLCVKIDNHLTPMFRSFTGVRQGDILSPNVFKIFLNDLPDIFSKCSNHVSLNKQRVDCLMYADDIVILSDTKEGLQERLNLLHVYCSKWCLNVNLNKTKVMIFNKPGKRFNYPFYYDNGKLIECTSNYKYLGITFTPSGKFSQCKDELYKKSIKACFKLQQCMSSSNPSVHTLLHLYDHTVKPILTYGCEIWGMFATNSAACKKIDQYLFEKVFENDISEKSQMKFMKYILGVNKKSSNIAVMSELGRYPLYFSIILSMLKYYHRLVTCDSDHELLQDAYICNQNLHQSNINTWFSSIEYILKKLSINNVKTKINSFGRIIKDKLCKSFQSFWTEYREKILESKQGKLYTYFLFKNTFGVEKYLSLHEFRFRQSICKIRISAHPLRVETDRYAKSYIDRAKRICNYCTSDKVEDEKHFIVECPLYHNERKYLNMEISKTCGNFNTLDDNSMFLWLFTQEDLILLKNLGKYIADCLEIRRTSNFISS